MRSILEEEVTVELQHINVKLLLKESASIALDAVIPVFHSWIQDQIFDELLLDVADYRHVKQGPGLMLIGHEADYSLDNTDGLLGLRYNRKASLAGTNLDRSSQATRSALLACQRLESDTRLNGRFRFNGQDVQLIINDRLLSPNDEKTRQAAAPDFQRLANKLFGHAELTYNLDPRRLLSASIRSSKPVSTGELLKNLAD
ncbi:MAG: hypothetical protein JWN74_3050 [Acidobacteriaceae bacterium]|nr:hypothetical protein [Acidobacteriaceae bacterium]